MPREGRCDRCGEEGQTTEVWIPQQVCVCCELRLKRRELCSGGFDPDNCDRARRVGRCAGCTPRKGVCGGGE